MQSKARLGVPDAAYLRPLLHGLDSPDSLFEPVVDLPAANAIHLNERTGNVRCAFLSPIDYVRYGGLYRIVPEVCVSSSNPTGTIMLTVKSGVRNIRKIAVDVRVTSEIILAKTILLERMRNLPEDRADLEFIPMMPGLDAMLNKADAAIIVNLSPTEKSERREFTLDLVEEWSDMTGLPYVHGFWVAREGDLNDRELESLTEAKRTGLETINESIRSVASETGLTDEALKTYFDSFNYDFGDDQVNSISEFATYAYFHGAIGDVPDLNFFETAGTT